MQIIDDIQASHAEFTALRRDIHAHPELGFEETQIKFEVSYGDDETQD